jgi:hypothetical protein
LTTWTEQLAGGDHAVVMGPRRVPSAPVRNFQALLGDMLDETASDDGGSGGKLSGSRKMSSQSRRYKDLNRQGILDFG